MDFAQALAADELWGWPVEVLDRLFALRSQAGAGSLSIEQWREQDEALRVGMPDVDVDEVAEFQTDWLVNGRDLDAPLTGRLTALSSPPPTDEQLWTELATIAAALADRRTSQNMRDAYRKRRSRAAGWLTRPGGGVDLVTGLPWSVIARYRVVDDPDFGRVPQVVDSARRLALRHASAAEIKRAALVAEDRSKADTGLADAKADMQQHRLTWFLNVLRNGAVANEQMRPLLDEVTGVWSDPRVQRLLLQETSAGWPDLDEGEERESRGQVV